MAVRMKKQTVKVCRKLCVNDRLMFLKISLHPFYFLVVQLCMPTLDHEDEEAEATDDEIEQIL